MTHGLGSAAGRPGLGLVRHRGTTQTLAATHSIDEPWGIVFGLVSRAEAERLLQTLQHSMSPAEYLDLPWAASTVRSDGSLIVTCSTPLTSGLFWANTPGGFVAATDPSTVVDRLPDRRLNREYLLAFRDGHVPVEQTPYDGVHRVPTGVTLRWVDGAVQQIPWLAPRINAEPRLASPAATAEFTAAIDTAVAALAQRTPTVVGAITGGLDSTFVAASLVHSTERAIHGFCHRPVGRQSNAHARIWDPDDWPWAQQMVLAYPNRITLRPLINHDVHPLDAAAAASALSGIPAFSPHNQVWMTQMTHQARDLGAAVQFGGWQGNMTFSWTHTYAAQYYLRNRDMRNLAGMVRDARGVRWKVLASARRPVTVDRDRWLALLTHTAVGNAAALNPAGIEGILHADPFTAQSVLEVAASITPRAWRAGALSRGFARAAGRGRVPDPIRLRTTRGGQAWDAADQWRADPARSRLALERLAGISWLADGHTLDWAGTTLESVLTAPQGTGFEPNFFALSRLLAVAEFVDSRGG